MRWGFSIAVWLMCGLILPGFGQARATAPLGFDLQGKPVARLAPPGAKAVVLLFLATDCPISNRYVPEIQRLEKEFAGKPVVFWIVYPNATETEASVVRHQASYGIQGATLVRPQAGIIALAHPTVTPESVVLVPDNGAAEGFRAAYVGRIDDRYVAFGKERPQATRHDLEDAITAVLNHQAVEPAGGPPIGCGIIREEALRSGAGRP
jgi:thiol-disulfide isomerase/thioredoxin